MERFTKRIAIPIDLQYAYPWHHESFQGIQQYADEHGWKFDVDPHHLAPLMGLDFSKYDGVVGRIGSELVEAVDVADVPAVTLTSRPYTHHLPCVKLETKSNARLAANHLLACGYRSLAYLGYQDYEDSSVSEHKLDCMAEPLLAAGLPKPQAYLHRSDYDHNPESSAETIQRMSQWLAKLDKPVGIYVWALYAARMLAQVAQDQGLRIPEDVGIVVQDGDRTVVSSVSPSLSSIDIDYFQHGYQAAALLDELMQGKDPEPRERFIEPKRIIVRESTEVFVCSDPVVSSAMHYIAEHVCENLPAEQVAEHVSVSRRTLERKFEEVLGKTVFNEIRRLRVEHIQRLLTETDRPIATIAGQCGFQEANHLSRYFRKETGESPSEYRKRILVRTS